MECPSCQTPIPDDAWICEACEFIVDPSVLMLTDESDAPARPAPERTHVVAWSTLEPTGEHGVPDAVLLGPDQDPDPGFEAVPSGDRGARSALFYAPGYTSRILAPDAVPSRAARRLPSDANPYERHVFSLVDGHRSVRIIQRASNLATEELTITLLTLQDRGLIRVHHGPPRFRDDDPVIQPSPLLAEDEFDNTVASEVPASVPGRLSPRLDDAAEAPTDESAQAALPPVPKPALAPAPPAAGSPSQDLEPPVLDPAELEPAPEKSAVVEAYRASERSDALKPLLDAELLVAAPPKPMNSPPAEDVDLRPPDAPSVFPATPARSSADDRAAEDEAADGRAPEDRERPDRRQALQRALRRGPVEERRRARSSARSRPPQAAGPPASDPASAPSGELPPEPGRRSRTSDLPAPPPRAPSQQIDPIRSKKAQQLYEQALKDEMEGNLVSARMNMKLALTFDPKNRDYLHAFDKLSKIPESHAKSGGGGAKSKAREYYDKATEAENRGDWDGAIEFLERALKESEQGAFYNRLGVLVATKKQRFDDAQAYIEKALELQPSNPLYERNLQKILQTMATRDVDDRGKGKKRGGLAGLFRRK